MTNTKKIIIVVFCVILSSCAFFTSYGRDCERAEIAYNAKNYEQAIRYCIKSLKNKPQYEKALKLYEKSIPLAINIHNQKINQYNNLGYEVELVKEYENLFNLINLIKEASISESYLLHTKPSYTKEYNIALQNAAEIHYKKGIELMSFRDKRNYKLAYNEFILSNHYINNYKESEKYIQECKNNSIFHITIMNFENNSKNKYNDLENSMSNKLISELSGNNSFNEFVDIVDRRNLNTIIEQLKFSTSGLVDEPQIELGKIKDIDHMIRGDINKIIVNEPKHTSERIKIKDNDNPWNTKYKKKHRLEAFVLIEVYLEIIDIETSEIINSETFSAELSYVDQWTGSVSSGNLLADIALSAILKDHNEGRHEVSSEEMLNDVSDEINAKMTTYLLEFYQ